jgi:hypothetical protein
MVGKNEPLTLSSHPNSALKARNILTLLNKGEAPGKLKTCCGLFLDIDLCIHVIKS